MNAKIAKNLRIILIALLTGVTAFSVFKYIVTARENYVLSDSLNQAKTQVAELQEAIEKERQLEQALGQENSALKDELRVNADKLAELSVELANAQKNLENLSSEIALSQAENAALREEKDKLVFDLAKVSEERDLLNSKLSSIPELKKAIKEVKMRTRNARVMIKQVIAKRVIIEGNHGYLIKDGRSTFPVSKVKIEVTPAPDFK
ncbi:MAG: hypothetical protein PHE18_04280 [Candidatus Omnitrophica bacterium]|nr:hypothetical protein [Candidatus Omnitrophota bacterium]MDD5553075.1 hypothetical protein [Candidatus Omnitrophota bacterium]